MWKRVCAALHTRKIRRITRTFGVYKEPCAPMAQHSPQSLFQASAKPTHEWPLDGRQNDLSRDRRKLLRRAEERRARNPTQTACSERHGAHPTTDPTHQRELVKRLVAIAVACRRWRDTRRRGARRTQKLLITRRAAYPRNARLRTPARAVRRGRRPGQPAGRVHRDQTPHPRSSGCPLPSVPATGSSRVAERRKSARS